MPAGWAATFKDSPSVDSSCPASSTGFGSITCGPASCTVPSGGLIPSFSPSRLAGLSCEPDRSVKYPGQRYVVGHGDDLGSLDVPAVADRSGDYDLLEILHTDRLFYLFRRDVLDGV